MTISLENIIPQDRIVVLEATTKEEALRELGDLLARTGEVTDPEALLAAIFERERIMSTGIGLGIAIPHAKIPSVKDFVVACRKETVALNLNYMVTKDVHFLLMIAGPDDQQERYLQLLARITLKLKDGGVRRRLAEAETPAAILAALK